MMRRLRTSTMPSVDVERFGAGWLAGRVERDLLHACLGLTQQFLTAPLERLAALVDRNRLLERDLAFLEPLDDRLQFLDRPLEGQFLDVGVVVFGHRRSRHLLPLQLDNHEYSHDRRARRSILPAREAVIPSTIDRGSSRGNSVTTLFGIPGTTTRFPCMR